MPVARILLQLIADFVVYLGLLVRRRKAIAAENLFLRRQLALYQERKVLKPSASFPFAQFEGRTVSLTCLGLILFDSTNLSVFDISNAMNQAYKSWYFAFGSSSIFIFTVCTHCVQPAVAAAQSARAIAESASEGVHAGLASPTPVSTRELAGDLVDLAGLPNPR